MATPSPESSPATDAHVLVARANLYLSREACETWLAGLQTVALLERDAAVLIVPLMPDSAGGLLLKVRNARGDRVIHAQEFFREHGFAEEFEERRCPMAWDEQRAALVIRGVPRLRV